MVTGKLKQDGYSLFADVLRNEMAANPAGTDIAAGRYNISAAGSSAYFARLDANLEIIDNNLSEGNVIAVVESGDWALSYTGTIEAMP